MLGKYPGNQSGKIFDFGQDYGAHTVAYFRNARIREEICPMIRSSFVSIFEISVFGSPIRLNVCFDPKDLEGVSESMEILVTPCISGVLFILYRFRTALPNGRK